MKQIIGILSLFLLITFSVNGQVFWTEDFGAGACNQGQLASDFAGVNGGWTINLTGANGSHANVWYVSAQEQGEGDGACGAGCSGTMNNTLHVGNVAYLPLAVLADLGASYLETGGGLPGVTANADIQVDSPTIDCTGQTDITLSFLYLEGLNGNDADPIDDNSELWYFDGVTWVLLEDLVKTSNACFPQGTWTAYNIALPASANNNPNVRIGFHWINDDDGLATDPSFAVDDITLSTPAGGAIPVAVFGALPGTICVNDIITMIDDQSTTDGTITAWNWTIPGATFDLTDPANPATVSWDTAGDYTISLTVTDENGTSEPFTFDITIDACLPEATFTINPAAICEGESISFTNNSTFSGPPPSVTWAWDFGNGNVSADQDPGNETYPTAGTFTVSLTMTDDFGTDTFTTNVVVADCSQPNAIFTVNETTICSGETVDFTDASLGTNIVDWAWTFVGGTPADFNGQNPGTVSYASIGTFEASLIITDDNGVSTPFVVEIEVEDCSTTTVVVNASDTVVCIGECITYDEASVGTNITNWEWEFEGGVITNSNLQVPPIICYESGGIFNTILTVTDDNGTTSDTTQIIINSLPAISLSALPGTTICSNEEVTLTATGGDAASWNNAVTDGVAFTPPTGTTTYIATVTDNVTTCSNTDQISISVVNCVAPEALFAIEGSESLCVGDCITFTNFTLGEPDSLIWDFGEFSNPSTFIGEFPGEVCYDSTGVFTATLTAINAFGSDIHTFDITVNENPEVLVSVDNYIVDFGNSVNLSANSFDDVTYSWTPAQTLENPFSQSPISTPIDEDVDQIIYTVTITDDNGCIAADIVTVNIVFEIGLGIPNAFSPEAAVPNNTFGPLGFGFEVHRFVVYNRYGQKVFETAQRNDLWDGTLDGKRLNSATFFWVLDYTISGETRKTQQGQVSLIH